MLNVLSVNHPPGTLPVLRDTACPQLIVSSSSQNTGTQPMANHNNGNLKESLVPIMGTTHAESWPTPWQSSAEGHIAVSMPHW